MNTLAKILFLVLTFAWINGFTQSTIFFDDFESNLGWTLNGEFEIATPSGLGGEHGNPDPISAYSGTNVLGVDLTGIGSNPGDYEANISNNAYIATTPNIDCSSFGNCHLKFQRWLGVENNSYDNARIQITNDGGSSWSTLWSNGGSTISETSWGAQDIDISTYANGNVIKIRFTIGSTDGGWQYCGWNIDDVKVEGDIIEGDDCTNAIDLSALTSPQSYTTTGYSNDFSYCSMGSSEDRIFYIDVDNGCIIDMWQSWNNYDSRHTMRYGGSCPGSTEIGCIDDNDYDHISWTNETGSTQRVYWINAGWSSSDGDFTLNWDLSCPCSTTAYSWTGAVSSDWNNSGNWYGGSVPTSSDDVIIPEACVTNWPVLNVNADCNDLTIEANAQLSCSSYNLNVYGDWANSGIFNSGTGSVYFKGNSNATLTITGSTQTILSEGFETGTTGWTLGSQPSHTEWRRQTGAPHNGSYDCASYDLDGNRDHNYYHSGTNIYVDLSRNVDLSDYSSASITYFWRCNSSSGTVNNIFSFDGTILKDDMEASGSSWHSATFSLNSYCGDYDNFMFFRMWAGSGVSGTPGLCIDDVTITGTPNVEHFNNLFIQKTGTAKLTLASSIKTKANLQISSGEFDANGYNITVAGNFTNNGTFTSGTGIAKFDGPATQTISGSSNTSFYKFIKNTSSDLVFSGSGTTITAANSFTWIDRDDKININGTNLNVIINDKVLVNMGCELDVSNGSTISIAKNFQNLGTIDLTSSTSVLKFHSNNNSYVLTEPGDTIFYDGFSTDPFAGSVWTIDQGGTDNSHRSDWRWSNGQQHAGTHDFAVMDNNGPTPYDYQWNSPADYCEAEISVDLTNYTGAILEFWWKCGGDDPAQASYDGDYGQVFVNGTAITEKLWGQQTYKKHLPISLADYAGQIITITFRFDQDGEYSGGHATSPGLCIDDILIYANCIQTLNLHDLLVSKTNNTTSTVVLCPIDANDDITVTQGILDASGNNISLEGNWTNAANTVFLPRQDTVTFDGNTNKTVDIGSTSFDNVFVNKPSATLSILNNTLDIDRDLKIFANSTLKSAGNNIEIGEDWLNYGTFTHDDNTVTFNGTSLVHPGGTTAGKRFYNVVLDGTSAVLDYNVRIENNFTITSGNWDVSTANRTMRIFGDFTCDDTFTERNGTVLLRDNGGNISFSSDATFYDLSIDKWSGTKYVTCLSNFSVTHNLTMINGGVDLKDKTIDFGTTGTLVNETNDNRVFSTDAGNTEGSGTGTITTTRTNPSGNIAGLGCEITPGSPLGITRITRGHLIHTDIDGNGHSSILKYFDIIPANNSGLNATFRFHYFHNGLYGQSENDLEMWRSTDGGSTWTNRAGTVNTGSDYVELAGIDAFSRWTLSGEDFPLPVTYLTQNNDCENNSAIIEWTTSAEINNDYFGIERSTDGINYEEIGQVIGAGNSNQINYYNFIDDNLKQDFYYYRIKQVDYNSEASYSTTFASYCKSNNSNVYITVKYNSPDIDVVLENTSIGKKYSLVFASADGKIIDKKEILSFGGQIVYSINKSTLQEGIYYIKFYNSEESFAQKVLIEH